VLDKLGTKMTDNKKTIRILALSLFSLGLLAGMFLAGAGAWSDLEATFYGFGKMADHSLTTLHCPVLMTATETGVIRADLANHSNKTVQAKTRIYISSLPIRTVETITPIASGETKELTWTVTSEDVALGNLILAKVLVYPYGDAPLREGWCGTLVLKVPLLNGSQVFGILLALSLVGLLGGIGLWVMGGSPLKGRTLTAIRAMICLTAFILVDMVFSFLGLWLYGLVLFVVVVVLILGVLTSVALAS